MIGDSVTNLGASAFPCCLSLNSVHFQGNAPRFGADVFDCWMRGVVADPSLGPTEDLLLAGD
jgi:hypothetical protein